MASTISITVKGVTSSYTSSMTDDETIEFLELAIFGSIGPPPPEADTPAKIGKFKLDHLLMELIRYIRRRAEANAEREAEPELEAVRALARERANF
jgi:hypothetical protein